MTSMTTMPDETQAKLARMRGRLLAAIPLYAGVAVLLGWLVLRLGGAIAWGAVGLGALGWLIALALRGPVSLAAMRLAPSPQAAQPWVVGASGPLEEGVRLGMLALVGTSLPAVLSLGLGWAAIEIVFAVVNGLVANLLLSKGDEKAQEALAVLEAQGMMREVSAGWGVLERIFASLAHIGFTMLVAAGPLWLLVTVPVHSAMNLVVGPLVKRSIVLAEAAVAVVGAVMFLGGLAALGVL